MPLLKFMLAHNLVIIVRSLKTVDILGWFCDGRYQDAINYDVFHYIFRDGRLREGDQIVALDEEIIHAGITHQQAIRFLQQAVGEVKIIVARSATPTANSPGSAPSTDLPPDQPISNSQYPPLEEQHHHHHVPSTCPAPPASPQAVPNNPEVVSDMVVSIQMLHFE